MCCFFFWGGRGVERWQVVLISDVTKQVCPASTGENTKGMHVVRDTTETHTEQIHQTAKFM